MALNTALKTEIVYFKEGEIITFPENFSGNKRVIVAVNGNKFEQRTHIKPFNSRRKISSILPSLLEDSLLNPTQKRRNMFTLENSAKNKFTSLSIKDQAYNQLIQKVSQEKHSPIVSIMPIPLGLSFFAEGENVVIASGPEGEIYACLCQDKFKLITFRQLPADGKKWKKEATATLREWVKENTKIVVEEGLYLPAEFAQKSEIISTSNMALLGLHAYAEEQGTSDLQLPVTDPALEEISTTFLTRLNRYFYALWALTLVTLCGLFTYQFNMESTANSLENEQQSIFNTALPNSPMVDAELQMNRKLNELQLASGTTLSGKKKSVADMLIFLALKMEDYDINVRFDTLSFSPQKITLRGDIESLSEVDRLQRLLGNLYPNYTFKLLNTEVTPNGTVRFGFEGA